MYKKNLKGNLVIKSLYLNKIGNSTIKEKVHRYGVFSFYLLILADCPHGM